MAMRAQCGTLKDHWYVGVQSRQVGRRKPVSTVIMETRLVLYRRADGQAVALRDRCPHRHQFLSQGAVRGDHLQCSYHGWTFNGQGHCVNVPAEGPCGKAFEGREVEAFPVREKDGLIWVWMGGDTVPQPGQEPPDLPALAPGWGSFMLENEFANSVGNCVENFLDVPHTSWVHTGWFRSRQGLRMPTTVERDAHGVLVTYHAQDQLSWGDRLFNPRRHPLKHTDRFIMPSTTRVDYDWGEGERGLIIISANTPVAPYLTRTYTFVAYRCGLLNGLFKLALPFYSSIIIHQDKRVLASQARSLQEVPPAFKHTPVDTQHLLVSAMRQWAQEGGTGEPPKPLTRQIEFWI